MIFDRNGMPAVDLDDSPEAVKKALLRPDNFLMWEDDGRGWFRRWALGPIFRTRDSDALQRANATALLRAMQARFGKPGLRNGWEVFHASDWLVGYVDYLAYRALVDGKPTAQFLFVQAWFQYLRDVYPCADEDGWFKEETEEADELWKNCYKPRERIAYIRKHRQDFEFRDFGDLIGCVRGNYFAGTASALLG